MTTENKVRSTNAYWHEFKDGTGIKTKCFLFGEYISWHTKAAKELGDSVEIYVEVEKYKTASGINSPIGEIGTIEQVEKKEYKMSVKQYREFIVKFWENGPEYYDMI